MLDTVWSARGVDHDHDTLYQATLMAYEMVRGEAPDPQWRALLYLGTGDRELWAWLAPRLDLYNGYVHLDDGSEPAGEPQRLLTMASHLFRGKPAYMDMAHLFQSLNARSCAVVLGAMEEYCG
jgi:hypothetical protein